MTVLTDSQRGAWSGTWKTFVEPDTLYDDSPLAGDIFITDEGATFEYHGSIGGDDVTGRLRWNGDGSIDWVDSWHTAGQDERLTGTPPSYEYGDGQGGTWIWDIEVSAEADTVTITHYNAGPSVPRYPGVVMHLTRS